MASESVLVEMHFPLLTALNIFISFSLLYILPVTIHRLGLRYDLPPLIFYSMFMFEHCVVSDFCRVPFHG